MPIIDYKTKAKKEIERFFQLKTISNKNKDLIKDFLVSYETSRSPARVTLFLKHIKLFLEKTSDIQSLIYTAKSHSQKEMEKLKTYKQRVNEIYHELQQEKGVSYYSTIINVSLMLVKHLNNDEMPDSFKQVKRVDKKKLKRHLKSSDMWTWEDGIKASNTTINPQSKAIILTQLDAGMRPSEFIDLNYGDVKILKDVIAIEDKATKNDKADPVILYRSVPYFLKWYNSHPTKNPNDPLWILNNEKSHGKEKKIGLSRLTYPALNKQIRLMAEKAEINKPFDFYNLRHSSCYLDKIENLPVELASKRHRHSTQFFIETYARLDVLDTADRYRTHYGIAKDEKETIKNRTCEMCGYVNEPDQEICFKCNRPLTMEKALSMEAEQRSELDSLKAKVDALDAFLSDQKGFKEYVQKRKANKA